MTENGVYFSVNIPYCNGLPTCTDLNIEKGIKKVVIGMLDPHPKINGSAVQRLRENGVKVEVLQGNERYSKLINKLTVMNREFINFQWKE